MCKQLARELASPPFGFSSVVYFLLLVLSCYLIEFRYSLPRFKIWEGGASVLLWFGHVSYFRVQFSEWNEIGRPCFRLKCPEILGVAFLVFSCHFIDVQGSLPWVEIF